MAFPPTTPNIHSGSSSTRLASNTLQKSRPATSSPENRRLLHEIHFDTENHTAPDQILATLPLDEFRTFSPALPNTIPVDCSTSIEATADYPYRHKSPFYTYLSPGYSTAQSPSMASDGMLEYSQDSSKPWMMTPTRDIEGSTPHSTSTMVSSGGTTHVNSTFSNTYDPSLSDGIPPIWSGHQHNHHTTHMNFRPVATPDHASDNGASSMLLQRQQPVPTSYLLGNGFQEDPATSYPYDSASSLTGVSTPGVSYGPLDSIDDITISISQNAHVPTIMGPSAINEQLTPEGDGQGPCATPQGGRTTQVCKSCRKKVSGPTGQEEHDKNCEGLPCLFYFAGCRSRCKGKNEWKRHLKTQHLLSCTYVCVPCHPKEFNRKDLFKQHYIRQHCTPEEKEAHKTKKPSAALLKWLEDKHTEACRRDYPSPPRVHECFMLGCTTTFPDNDSWEKCLEHVAKHHEAMMKGKEVASQYDFTPEQLRYFVEVKALVPTSTGGWKLGAQSDGERARQNKKKIPKRSAESEPQASTTRAKRARKSRG